MSAVLAAVSHGKAIERCCHRYFGLIGVFAVEQRDGSYEIPACHYATIADVFCPA